MLTLRLSGKPAAIRATLEALAALPCVQLPVVWEVAEKPGRCVIREGSRSTVASTWRVAVDLHLAPQTLKPIRVMAPTGRWM